MKTRSIPSRILSTFLLLTAVMIGLPAGGRAAELPPPLTGDSEVAAAITGLVNHALASGGATSFSSSDLGPDFNFTRVNDGVIDHSGNSWIAAATDPTEFVAVTLPAATTVGAIVFHGQTGYNGRSAGVWSVQYTTDAVPAGGSTWVEIGTYTYVEPTCAQPMPRSLFEVPAIAGVTGVRLVATTSDCPVQNAIQELEVYEPIPATVLTPSAVGDVDVANASAGLVNHALASGGGMAFSSSDLGATWSSPKVNDGVIDHSGDSWISATTGSAEFVAVATPTPFALEAVVFHGQTGYNSRSASVWSLQYTRDAVPAAGSAWVEIGIYTYDEPTCAEPMPRTLFNVGSIANVTAVRLVPTTINGCDVQKAVQELELYGTPALAPAAVGDVDVATAVSGRANHALASAGGTSFSSSDLGPDFDFVRVNDGVIDQSGNSWIAATTGPEEFVAVATSAPLTLDAIVFHGQTGYNGRSSGIWSVEYTTDAAPTGASAWTVLGTYTHPEPSCAEPMIRTLFSFAPVNDVTAVRLVATTFGACNSPKAVQELEIYGTLNTPPAFLAQPVGGNSTQGDDFTLSAAVSGAETLQWWKDGVVVPGATGQSLLLSNLKLSDAGSYVVVASNGLGSVTSNPAVLTVDPGPVFADYASAILTHNPIHYYPLDETEGTTANDLGSLALAGGTYTGGFTLAQPSAQPDLGSSVGFDGLDGSFVDLGLFHPGNDLTIEAWVKLDVDARANSFHAVVARWDGSFELDFAPSEKANLVIKNDSNTFGIAEAAAPSGRGQWHHLVAVFSGGVLTIYVDGVQGTQQDIGGVLQDAGPSPDRILIGATRTGTLGFKGLIDEVAIYDYALTPVQLRSHYRTALNTEDVSLTIQKAVIISWPTFPAGIVLQSSTDVEGPYEDATGTVYFEGNAVKMAVPTDPAVQQFFQLLFPEL